MKISQSLLVATLAAAAPLATAHGQPSSEPTSPEEPAAAPAPSDAPRSEPSIGIGLAQTLDGTRGLSLRYGRRVQVELVVGGYLNKTPWAGEYSPTEQRQLDVAARLLVPILRRDAGWVGLVAGVDGHRNTWTMNRQDESSTWASLEAGIHAEWFVAPALSIGFEVGGVATRVLDNDSGYPVNGVAGAEDSTDVGLGRAAYSGAASVTYWLDAEQGPDAAPASGLRFGVGASQGVDGTGLGLAVDVGRLRLELAGRRETESESGFSVERLSLSAGALYEVARHGRAALLTGARVGLTRFEVDSDYGFEQTDLSGELPVRIELDATPWLSVHAEGGLVVRSAVDDHDEVGVAALGGGGATGAVGFTIWH